MDEPVTFGFLEEDELNIAVYSNPDFDHTAVPLGHLLTLREQWLCAAEGPVDGGLIARMEEHDFDQAPALGSFGVRLVARETLRALHEAGEPLGPQTRFIDDDTLLVGQDHYSCNLLWCILAVSSRQAAIVLQTPGHRVTPEERAAVLAEAKRIQEENKTRSWQFSYPTVRSDFYVWGLLTQADLNRKPIRRAIFEQLYDLEVDLGKLVANHHLDPRGWIELLSEKDQQSIMLGKAVGSSRGASGDPLWSLTVTQLLRIVRGTPALLGALGITSYEHIRAFERAQSRVIRLRNQVMHPVQPLIASPEDVEKLARSVSAMITLAGLLRDSHRGPQLE